ncbi:protein PPP1R35 homolog [Aedes albopictus]|uniref:Protein phosphatase 1 regulatory subunit 35 C-terminal domain-containing protein n=1 Tax=Aedes albopictus TaxID=7160 RepID=A0ABM1Z1M5_AEDAL
MSKPTKANCRKFFLRNVEIPVANSKAQVLKASQTANTNTSERTTTRPKNPVNSAPVVKSTAASAASKYKEAELHSALNVRKEIEKVKSLHAKAPTSIGELTPKSKKFVRDQVTKKLNFQHDENVFKGLVPVNVNDSVLIPTTKKPLRSSYVVREKRDPEPELGDFLRPIAKCNVPLEPYLAPQMAPRRPNFNNFDHILEVFAKVDVGA